MVVELHQRIGEVIVVNQNQVRRWELHQLRHRSARTLDVEFHTLGALDLAINQGIQADRNAVRTKLTRTRLRTRLLNRKVRVHTVLNRERRAQSVDTGGRQPLLSPPRQIPTRGLG